MKKNLTMPFLLLLISFSYCGGLTRISKDKALEAADFPVGSATAYTYVGTTKQRVYIEYLNVIHLGSSLSREPDITMYWLPITELKATELDKIKHMNDLLENIKPTLNITEELLSE